MAHAQKPDLVFQRNGRVHLYRRGVSVQSAAGSQGVRISGSNAGYTVFWGRLQDYSTRMFPLHFPYRASPCAITFQLSSTCHNNATAACCVIESMADEGNTGGTMMEWNRRTQRICTTAVSSSKNSSFVALGVSPVCSIHVHLAILQGCTVPTNTHFALPLSSLRYRSPNAILAQLKNCQLELLWYGSKTPAQFLVKTYPARCQ